MRDRFVHWLGNILLQKVATPEYGGYMSLMIQYGMLRLAQDEGDESAYRNFWTPTKEQRYKMLQSFITNEEALTLATNPDTLVFITKEKVEVRVLNGTTLQKED